MVLDENETVQFKRRWFNALVKSLYWEHYSPHKGRDYHKNDTSLIVKDAMEEIRLMDDSYESAIQWVDKYSRFSLSNWIWTEVLQNPALWVNTSFINSALINCDDTLTSPAKEAITYGYPRPPSEALHKKKSKSRWDRESEVEDCEDEKEVSPTRTTKVLDREVYFFGNEWLHRGDMPKQVVAARMLSGNNDPHALAVDFMVKHDIVRKGRVKGMMLSQADTKQPPGYHLTLNCADPKTIFDLYRSLSARDLSLEDVILSTENFAQQVTRGLPEDVSYSSSDLDRRSRRASSTVLCDEEPAQDF
jgi:hypothetical protein